MQFTGDGDTHAEACFNTEAGSNSVAAAHCSASSDTAADAYRFGAFYAGATVVGWSSLRNRGQSLLLILPSKFRNITPQRVVSLECGI
jgi:hypothetical protein